MNEVQLFSSPEFGEIRTLEINGEHWSDERCTARRAGNHRCYAGTSYTVCRSLL